MWQKFSNGPVLKAFLKHNLPLVAFGLLLSYFSGFGQTFLLSLYVPDIEAFLQINNTEFGSIYAIATVGSALTLPWIGGYFDKMKIHRYSLMVIMGLAVALLTLSFAQHLVVVVLAFYGLRLFGQALMGHTSVSTMARYFDKNRGKAIGVATLGHPAGEATLPILIALLISILGWRLTLQLSALQILLVVAPLAWWLLNKSKTKIEAYAKDEKEKTVKRSNVKLGTIISQKKFWVIVPVVFMLGFINTAIFFFQLKLGAEKGWSPEWVAASISAFAIASAIGMLGSGPLVDRFTGKKLFPIFMLPYLVGLLVLVNFEHPLTYPVALAFMGLANGSGSTVKNAMLAEMYGIQIIGQIRSIFTTVMVLSTALGPLAFGLLLDQNFTFNPIFIGSTIAMALTILYGFRLRKI